MLVLLVIVLLINAVIVLHTNPNEESNRWYGRAFFIASCGALSSVIQYVLIPFVQENISNNNTIIFLLSFFSHIVSSLGYCFGPYCFLVFALTYSQIFKNHWTKLKNRVLLLLLIPIAITYILNFSVPENSLLNAYMGSSRFFWFILVWAIPYGLYAKFLLLYSVFKEKRPRFKQQNLLICFIVIPIITGAMFNNYIFRALSIHNTWKYNAIIIIIQFLVFIVVIVKYGVLGIHLRIEKRRLNTTRKALSLGTSVLNNAIRNEIEKISLSAEEIISSTSAPSNNNDKSAETILSTTGYLLNIVGKVQLYLRDIVLEEKVHSLSSIIDNALSEISSSLESKNVHIDMGCEQTYCVLCDSLYIGEAFKNIFLNSCEAFYLEGVISIQVYSSKKHMVVSVKDNGKGVSKENLPRLFEPFFSTKDQTMNFGLGLSYCYNIMQKHGGSIEILSEEGKGTTVLLNFPKNRLISMSSASMVKEVS
ncbi:MAG: HAMP domain-containing histidine kinase [Clostridia bacterium]|nr:HAMP domain-containing histidine kinase [Clostridia bacterium]